MKKFKNIAIIAVAMVLVFALGVGATLAYFVSESKLVVNTFTPTKFGKPEVTETTTEYVAIPGVSIDKNPRVKYTPGTDTADQQAEAYLYLTIKLAGGWTASTDAYTFTKVVGDAADKLDFTLVRSNWSYLGKTSGGVLVYAYIDSNGNEKKLTGAVENITVITNDKVYVSDSITKEDVADLNYTLGSVTFGAYAVQAKFDQNKTAKEAWNLVNTSIQITKK